MMVVAESSLFNWHKMAEIETLRCQRTDLVKRIKHLPIKAHKRLILEARLSELTVHQLELERRGDK